jgi:Reverse transcriptase (RNA-dependent DNA polymerase)
MFGVEIPHDSKHTRILDQQNQNCKWQDVEYSEIQQLTEYNFANDLGPGDVSTLAHKRIRCRMVYAVKHDSRHKAGFVAGGHLMKDPEDSIYSSVVSIRSLRIVLLAAELNKLELMSADVGNTYLEALTNEKIYFIGGPEFSPFGLEGHTLILYKALYGLKSSGQEWHKVMATTLKAEGFTPSIGDPDVWMHKHKDQSLWEYICV